MYHKCSCACQILLPVLLFPLNIVRCANTNTHTDTQELLNSMIHNSGVLCICMYVIFRCGTCQPLKGCIHLSVGTKQLRRRDEERRGRSREHPEMKAAIARAYRRREGARWWYFSLLGTLSLLDYVLLLWSLLCLLTAKWLSDILQSIDGILL